MGNIDFSVSSDSRTFSYTCAFKEDGVPHKAGTPSLNQALMDAIARVAGAYDIAGALESWSEQVRPLVEALNGAGVTGVNSEASQRRTEAGPDSGPSVEERIGKAKLVAELNIDAGTSFVDESHPHADRLREFFGEQLAEHAVPKDYGVRNMTASEVQRLLDQKDRELATAQEAQSKMNDLRREANERAALKDRENEKLREALEGIQAENMRRIRFSESQEADLNIRRQNVADLSKQLEAKNAAIRDYVAETHAQAARISDLSAALEARNAAFLELQDQFTDQTERFNVSQRELRNAQQETKEQERRVKLKEAKLRAAAKERRRLLEQLGHSERHDWQLRTSLQSVKELIESDSGALSSEMIHKSDAIQHVMSVLVPSGLTAEDDDGAPE